MTSSGVDTGRGQRRKRAGLQTVGDEVVNFDTTIANRIPFADWLPSMMVRHFFTGAGAPPPRVLTLMPPSAK